MGKGKEKRKNCEMNKWKQISRQTRGQKLRQRKMIRTLKPKEKLQKGNEFSMKQLLYKQTAQSKGYLLIMTEFFLLPDCYNLDRGA